MGGDKREKDKKLSSHNETEELSTEPTGHTPVEDTDDEKSRRKAEKAAKKAAKRARREAEEIGTDGDVKEAAEVADEPDVDAEDAERARRKAEKKARKAAEKAEAERKVVVVKGEMTDAAGPVSGQKRKRTASFAAAEAESSPTAGAGAATWPNYTPSAEVRRMSATEVAEFRSANNINVDDAYSKDNEWKPITQFAHATHNFGEDLMKCTKTFSKPSPIQAQSWPVILSGRDIIGIASTGSGKTLAFMMPGFMHILARKAAGAKPKDGPVILVLSPTRELAMQTAAVTTEAGGAAGITSCCVYGGVDKDAQKRELRAGGGVDVVIATPGRLLDLLEEKAFKLGNVTYLVLDEADRMLDLGFEKDIRRIMSMLPTQGGGRQTIMFSATWPPAIQSIASEFLHKPVKVTIGSAELAASSSVTQIVEVVEDPRARDSILLKLLSKYHASRKNRVLVFVLYKKEAARVETFLNSRGWKCCAIQGDMSQEARTRSFNAFKSGTIPLLIATDVAARGLDIPNVEYVINYSFPLTIEDYVHRIGRTGRGGKTGTAHTLFTPLDKAHAGELVNVLREADAPVPPELLKFGTHVKKKEHALYGAHFKGEGGAGAVAAPKVHMTFD